MRWYEKDGNRIKKKKRKGSIDEQYIRSISGKLRADGEVFAVGEMFTDEGTRKKLQLREREPEECAYM